MTDPIAAYQMVTLLQGVVKRGTGRAHRQPAGPPFAGKTGTTNDCLDTWFVGFSPDLVVGVWVGFDEPRSLGDGETGGGNAAPIFHEFMAAALRDSPAVPFRTPPGVRTGAGRMSGNGVRSIGGLPARAPSRCRAALGRRSARHRRDRLERQRATGLDSNLGGLY